MTIVYYTQVYYLDAVVEILKSIKYINDIHLIVEINQESKNSSMLDIRSLDNCEEIENISSIITREKWESLAPFMENLGSAKLAIFKEPKAGSVKNIRTGRVIGTYINNVKPDIIHFDTLSFRTIWLYPWLTNKNISVTIHDSVSHSGEGSWKDRAAQKLYKSRIENYFFYSFYSRNIFLKENKSIRHEKTTVLHFEPYSYYRNLKIKSGIEEPFILFFGRISTYKGIDILIDAIPDVLKCFPNEKFVIAGKGNIDNLKNKALPNISKNIRRIDKYLDCHEISELIEKCKFVVCPYRDASQSGVLMTTYAMGKSVLASNVGAFPEYINNGKNGKIVYPDAKSLSKGIIDVLNDKKYLEYEDYISRESVHEITELNRSALQNTYQRISK